MKSRASISDERRSSDRERMKFYPLPTDSVIRSTLERFEKSDYYVNEREIYVRGSHETFQRCGLQKDIRPIVVEREPLKECNDFSFPSAVIGLFKTLKRTSNDRVRRQRIEPHPLPIRRKSLVRN